MKQFHFQFDCSILCEHTALHSLSQGPFTFRWITRIWIITRCSFNTGDFALNIKLNSKFELTNDPTYCLKLKASSEINALRFLYSRSLNPWSEEKCELLRALLGQY